MIFRNEDIWCQLPSGKLTVCELENHPLKQWENPLKMAIVNSYVSLPEGNVSKKLHPIDKCFSRWLLHQTSGVNECVNKNTDGSGCLVNRRKI